MSRNRRTEGVGLVTMENAPIDSQNASATEKGRPDSIRAANRPETESVTNVSTHSPSRKGL